jgi:hypothetical protein
MQCVDGRVRDKSLCDRSSVFQANSIYWRDRTISPRAAAIGSTVLIAARDVANPQVPLHCFSANQG